MVQCSSCGLDIHNDGALFCPRCGAKTGVSAPDKFPHDISKIWPEWVLEKQIGKGSYGIVYQAVRTDDFVENRRAAIKIISIPTDKSEIDSLRSEGLDYEKSRTYFKDIVDEFVKEIEVMESLKGMQNIVSVEDYKVVEKKDEIGWDIYIRMELLTPLNSYIVANNITESDVIALGSDMCTALEYCNKIGIIHRDIKPENIFVNDFGDFKLGDFGIARKLENQTGSFSRKGTYGYMAPEVFFSRPYDHRADLYSLGVVLYRMLNNQLLPLMEQGKPITTPAEKTAAIERRLRGEELPAPVQASEEMASLILCACRYEPEKRFSSAVVMKKALESVKHSNYGNCEYQEGILRNDGRKTKHEDKNVASAVYKSDDSQEEKASDTRKSKGFSAIAIIALAALLIVSCVSGGVFAAVNLIGDKDEGSAEETTGEVHATVNSENNNPQNSYDPYRGGGNENVSIIYTPGNKPASDDTPEEVVVTVVVSERHEEEEEKTTKTVSPSKTTTTTTERPTSVPTTQKEDNSVKKPSTKTEIINFYKDAVNKIKYSGKAGYTVFKWQEIDEINLGGDMVNNAARSIIERFITTEDEANEKVYSKGSNSARDNFAGWNLSDNSYVVNASCTEDDGCYIIEIRMAGEDTPKKSGSFLAQVSDSVIYWENVDKILSTDSAITKVLSDYDDVHIYYNNYVITAMITPEGEFLYVNHSADIEIFVGSAKILFIELNDKSGYVNTNTEYYNFNY